MSVSTAEKSLLSTRASRTSGSVPACSCAEYQCFPMTHIRPDVKTPEDAKNPPKRGKSFQ